MTKLYILLNLFTAFLLMGHIKTKMNNDKTEFKRGCHFGTWYYHKTCYDLSARYLKEVPDNTPADAKHLLLSNNLITTLRAKTFESFGRLVEIDLSSNAMVEIEEGAFIGLPKKIWTLFLYKNKLRRLQAKMWKGLKEIRTLYLMSNELTSLSQDSFGSDLDITYVLSLSRNKIKYVDPNLFQYMPTGPLSVFLNDNELEWIPCFRDKQLVGNRLGVYVEHNPLRCQPHSCWKEDPDWVSTTVPDSKYNKHKGWKNSHCEYDVNITLIPVCQQLNTLDLTNTLFCCKAVKTQPSITCMSNTTVSPDIRQSTEVMKRGINLLEYIHNVVLDDEELIPPDAFHPPQELRNLATQNAITKLHGFIHLLITLHVYQILELWFRL